MAEIGTVITRFKNEGVDDVISQNSRIINQLKELSNQGVQSGTGVKALSTALKDNMAATYGMSRGISGIRMSFRVAYADVLEFSRVMSGIGSIGNQMLGMWQAYTIGIYRVDNATRHLAEVTGDAAHWQFLYNQYLRDFGADSPFTQEALANWNKLLDQSKQATDELVRANNSMNLGYISMGLSIPTMIASLIDIGVHVSTLTALIAAKGGLIPAIKALGLASAIPIILPVTLVLILPEIFNQFNEKVLQLGEWTKFWQSLTRTTGGGWSFLPLPQNPIPNPLGGSTPISSPSRPQPTPTPTPIINDPRSSNYWSFPIPQYGVGAYVNRPTVALIGEDEPEYVIPESKMRGGGNNMNLRMNQTNYFYNNDNGAAAAERAYKGFIDMLGCKR